ncbi:hypothetical protein BH23ACT9_BH23ACT9_17560 [soil metagenome]
MLRVVWSWGHSHRSSSCHVFFVPVLIGMTLSLREDIGDFLRQAGPAALLLNLGGIAVGWASGALSGLRSADRLTLAIELGVKNSTLGILLAVTLGSFAYAVPSAVYGVLMYASAAALVVVGRRQAAAADDRSSAREGGLDG